MPLFVTDRSALAPVVLLAVALLFAGLGSVVVDAIVAVLLIVPVAAALTATTSVNVALPGAKVGFEQLIVAPGVHVHPGGGVIDTNVVPAGSTSVSVTVVALLGPALIAMMV